MAKVVADWRRATLDQQEFALLEFAEKLTLMPSLIGPDDVERLQDVGLTEQQIFAGIQAICYRNFISRIADSLGVELDDEEAVAPEILEAFRGRQGQPPAAHAPAGKQAADR